MEEAAASIKMEISNVHAPQDITGIAVSLTDVHVS